MFSLQGAALVCFGVSCDYIHGLECSSVYLGSSVYTCNLRKTLKIGDVKIESKQMGNLWRVWEVAYGVMH